LETVFSRKVREGFSQRSRRKLGWWVFFRQKAEGRSDWALVFFNHIINQSYHQLS